MTVKELLNGKRIVVTGSSSGSGAETAKILAEQGTSALGVDLSERTAHITEFCRA